jgi:hypothetical protein
LGMNDSEAFTVGKEAYEAFTVEEEGLRDLQLGKIDRRIYNLGRRKGGITVGKEVEGFTVEKEG